MHEFNCSPNLELKFPITVEDEISLPDTPLWYQLIIMVHWTKGITGL